MKVFSERVAMRMDTGEGGRRGGGSSSSSYHHGQGGGGGYNATYRGGGRGGGNYYGNAGKDQNYYGNQGGGNSYATNSNNYNTSYGNFSRGGYQGSGGNRGYWGGRGRRGGRGGRGGGYYQSNQQQSHQQRRSYHHQLPSDVEFLSELKGHTKKITCLSLDYGSGQLFTGSHDGTVRVWSCASGECTSTVQVGGEVDSMLIEAGFLCVGLRQAGGQGCVKIWNMATQQETLLEGHVGRIECLAAANGMLFSGGQDKSIRVWKVNPASGVFECAAVLQEAQDGHRSSVATLCASGPYLFSGDSEGTIKVWDLEAGVVRQTLERAHHGSTHPAIMSLLVWEGHLISGSLDGLVKIWEPADPVTGSVIHPVNVYEYPERDVANQSSKRGGRGGRGGRYRQPDVHGILSMCGVADVEGKAVLMVSYNTERAIKLFELPTFTERGELGGVTNSRAMAGFAPGRLMMSGDEHGRVKIWRWVGQLEQQQQQQQQIP